MKREKGFTLFEIIISIILVSILYLFAINSFELKTNKESNLSLKDLKKELLSYEYENSISIKCIEKDYSCFLFKDGILQDKKLIGLFSSEPIVYNYDATLDEVEFHPLELEKLERHEVIFEYACNNQRKCTETIVYMNEIAYIFNDIKMKPKIVKNISEIENYFQDKIQEVKDAF